jgi:ribonuclease-3
MSRPRLHETLEVLFETKEQASQLFIHPDFQDFKLTHGLSSPVADLARAFTHKSFSHEFNVFHQELLEFLGDAVLQLILTDELYKRFPDAKEGDLSKLRSAIVNEKSLALIAKGLKLQELIIVGKGEYKKKLFLQDTVLADTFEALLANMYQNDGFSFTRGKFLEWLGKYIPSAFDENFLDHFDAKSKLQELVLSKYKKLPRYTSEASGDHFEVTLWINEVIVERGVFPSKKSGEKELAQSILRKGHI